MAIWTKDSSNLDTNNSYIKYRIRVILESQNIANNTSNVTVQVQVWRTNTGYTTRGTGTVNVNINGTNYSAGITSSQRFTYNSNTQIFTRNLNISHGSDGAKTLNTSASISHSQFSSSSQSYNPALNTIPRASTLSAFSFASNLKPSTEVTINYKVDRKSTAFRHQVQLSDGSHVVQTWDNQDSNGASTVKLSTASVNSLLSRMSSVTSRSLTLRVATRSGVSGGWIGSAVTRNATATVDATVKPTVGALSVSQTGNSVSTHYLQGKSKVKASFTRTAVGGTTIANSSITVRRKTTNTDVQTINSNDGTTGKTVSLTGTYEAQGMAKDSRGRTTYTEWAEFTVTAYTSPRITTFTAVRKAADPTTVYVTRKGTHTSLGRANSARMLIEKRVGNGAWGTVQDLSDSSGVWNANIDSPGNSVTTSYEYRATLTDSFGEFATATVTVSTQRVVLDIHKNEGVGIGKVHEQGVLDVDGEAYFRGDLYVNGVKASNSQSLTDITPYGQITDTFAYWQNLPQGTYAVHRDNTIPNQPSPAGIIINTSPNVTVLWYSQPSGTIFRKSGGSTSNITGWIPIDRPERGSNGNGTWIKFNDGTLICWQNGFSNNVPIQHLLGNGLYRSASSVWTFPQQFGGGDVVVTAQAGSWERWVTTFDITTTEVKVIEITAGASSITSRQRLMAIGRWK